MKILVLDRGYRSAAHAVASMESVRYYEEDYKVDHRNDPAWALHPKAKRKARRQGKKK